MVEEGGRLNGELDEASFQQPHVYHAKLQTTRLPVRLTLLMHCRSHMYRHSAIPLDVPKPSERSQEGRSVGLYWPAMTAEQQR